MGIQLMLVAGLFIALSNYFMRKSIDTGGTTKGFLMVQLLIAFIVAILLNPVRLQSYEWSTPMALFGLCAGIVLAFMLASLGRALETGPPGLTFAALNSSTVMPSVVMVLLFGTSFDYQYTLWNGVGSILVILGLFWAGWQTSKTQQKHGWRLFVWAAFTLHIVFLVCLSWKALFLNYPGETGLFLSFDMDAAKNQWFMPMIFLAAFVVQTIIYGINEKRWLKKGELLYGALGGIANGLGTFFMIQATEKATALEHAMIYPIFSITVIILCNLWGQWLYLEKVNWKATALCVLGILIGTINWAVFFV